MLGTIGPLSRYLHRPAPGYPGRVLGYRGMYFPLFGYHESLIVVGQARAPPDLSARRTREGRYPDLTALGPVDAGFAEGFLQEHCHNGLCDRMSVTGQGAVPPGL
jgi:hypothetical protein